MPEYRCGCRIIVEAFDWGPAITGVCLTFPDEVDHVPLSADVFSLIIKKRNTRYRVMIASVVTKIREVQLKLASHPDYHHLSPFVYDQETHHDRLADKIELLVQINKPFTIGGVVFSEELPLGEVRLEIPALDGYGFGEYRFDQRLAINYGLFEPQASNRKVPLVIWLHGAKEGGTDPRIPILGNPVSYLTGTKYQELFQGFYVLVPQAKTMWMDDGSGMYTKTGTSMYLKALRSLIEKIIDDHPGIDRYRVYLGGCSNGGFMTIKLLAQDPRLIAAAFPASEACLDEWLSDQDIANLKQVPLWFFACRNDTVISPELCSLKTYQRLLAAESKTCLLTLTEEIRDASGLYQNHDGSPYLYDAHWSWLIPLNDTASHGDRSFMEWLFSNRRP